MTAHPRNPHFFTHFFMEVLTLLPHFRKLWFQWTTFYPQESVAERYRSLHRYSLVEYSILLQNCSSECSFPMGHIGMTLFCICKLQPPGPASWCSLLIQEFVDRSALVKLLQGKQFKEQVDSSSAKITQVEKLLINTSFILEQLCN